MAGKTELVEIQVDVETEETLILDLAVLSDHKNVLLRDEMVYTVGDLLGRLLDTVKTNALNIIFQNLLNHIVDDVSLGCRVLSISLELLDSANNEHRQALELVEGDLDLLFGLLSCSLRLLRLGCLLFGFHPEEVVVLVGVGEGLLLLSCLGLTIHLLLVISKLDIASHQVYVRDSQQAAYLTDIARSDHRVGM